MFFKSFIRKIPKISIKRNLCFSFWKFDFIVETVTLWKWEVLVSITHEVWKLWGQLVKIKSIYDGFSEFSYQVSSVTRLLSLWIRKDPSCSFDDALLKTRIIFKFSQSAKYKSKFRIDTYRNCDMSFLLRLCPQKSD